MSGKSVGNVGRLRLPPPPCAATTSRIPKPSILLLLHDVTTTFLLNAHTRIHKPFHFYWTGQEKTHFRSLFTLQAILACHHNLMI